MITLSQKLKFRKNAKNDRLITLELLCAKNRLRKHKYSRNETILKIGHQAKPIAVAKYAVWVKNSNKNSRNDSFITLELFCAKNRLRKHQIFEK